MNWQVFVDGASRGNPGLAAVGFVLISPQGEVFEHGYYIGRQTNNIAEYSALLSALQALKSLNTDNTPIDIFADSELMVKQINGIYRVKNEAIKPIYQQIMLINFSMPFKLKHVLRHNNKDADRMANHGADNKVIPPKELVLILKKAGLNLPF